MNRITLPSATIGLTVMIFVGCTTPSGRVDNTAGGALVGGAVGAGAGAIIGHQSKHAGQGALIGGAVGALTGALVGNSMDQAQRDQQRQLDPGIAGRPQPLGLADIKALTKSGVSDEVIMSQIRNSRVVYRLTTAEIIDLKDAGVSNRIIDFMINTPSLYPPPPPRRNYY